jgi:hypothetical protein
MFYAKPEIYVLGSSVEAIRNSPTPKQCQHPDSHNNENDTTTGAYEADE